MVLAFAAALVLTTSEPADAPAVPWFVPRSATLGVLVNPPAVTGALRLAWEGTIVTQSKSQLLWVLVLGTGAGLALPEGMRELYQHVMTAGLGYRYDAGRLHWGFQVGAGVLWYRAAYPPMSFYRFESRVSGYAEGRAQLGLRVTPHLVLGLFGGYASPFVVRSTYPGSIYAGGFAGGLYVNWR